MIDDHKQRADARENRNRILQVARDALTADPQASLNSIAKSAGVGAGTLYRHFPSREALILGVYRHEIAALVDLAPALLDKHRPLEAFRLWSLQLIEFGKMKHGVADLLSAAKSDRDFQETYWPLLDAVRMLMSACEASGEFNAGTDAEDILVFMGLLWRIPPGFGGDERIKRLLLLLFQGLAAA